MNRADVCETMRRQMGALFDCADFGDYYRIRTPYLYPDGDTIDLFCEFDGDLITVTDDAETTGWLQMQSQALRRSSKQNRLIQDACQTHGVEFFRGMLQARCRPEDNLADVVNRVSQAALRVSDLYFTLRHIGVGASVAEDVADYLVDNNLPYEANKKLNGRSARAWNVDFHVRAPAHSSLVYVLSAGNRATANRLTDHVVAAWHDLSYLSIGAEPLRFVSLFDDATEVWREEDFRQAESLSTVAFWSRQDEFARLLSEVA